MGESEQRLDPLCVTGGEIAHGPITAKHHPIPSERLNYVFDEWTQIICLPIRRIRVRDKSRNLACNIGKFRELADMFAPRIERLTLHIRDTAVVENERDIRAL